MLRETLDWAKNYVDISENDIKIIIHSRKIFIFHEGDVWIKNTTQNVDVTQGSYDGAEVAELVGLYLLNKVNAVLPNAGLYRDDGLTATSKSGPEIAKIEKILHNIFKMHGLKITIEPSSKYTDFLDIWFNLETGTYKPWKKPNSNPRYVHKDSCHPKPVIEAIPNMISRRLIGLSSSEEEYNDVKDDYSQALKEAGYNNNLEFTETPSTNNKRKRSRKIVWFNPPYSNEVSTNITKLFNNIIAKHFKPGTLMGKLFNKNNLKLSYSCCPNMSSLINKHNRKLLNQNNITTVKKCNCQGGSKNCPVNGRCQESDIIYNADIKVEGEGDKLYIGATATDFKKRYGNHKSSFKNETYKHSTMLSTYVWNVKENSHKQPQVNFKIKKNILSYRPEIEKCNLCIGEKKEIILADENKIINRNDEILTKCRHRNKYLLQNWIQNKRKKNK